MKFPFVFAVAALLVAFTAFAANPELPRELVDTTMPNQREKITPVAAGGDLQKALNDAQPGDTLVL